MGSPDIPRFRGKDQLVLLEAELERQAGIYRALDVPKDVVMRLVAPRPDRLPKYLTIPVVELGTSVSLERQAGLAGITPYYDLSRGHDIAGGITFGEPHLVWMQDGSKYTNKSVERVRQLLAGKVERPLTQYGVVALALVYQDIRKVLKHHVIDVPGTAVEADSAPSLRGRDGELRLGHNLVHDADPNWGSASCGS